MALLEKVRNGTLAVTILFGLAACDTGSSASQKTAKTPVSPTPTPTYVLSGDNMIGVQQGVAVSVPTGRRIWAPPNTGIVCAVRENVTVEKIQPSNFPTEQGAATSTTNIPAGHSVFLIEITDAAKVVSSAQPMTCEEFPEEGGNLGVKINKAERDIRAALQNK